jgi:hypothetical protein
MKAVYICADQPVTLILRLRQSGGPYIPVCRRPCKSSVKGRHRCPGHARESVQVVAFRMFSTQRMPLGIGSCARQNQTSICCLGP